MQLKPLPVSSSFLARYQLQAQRRMPANILGGHITHRKGHSLEFREYGDYVIGDDVRHIDWRASARTGNRDRRIVRKFDAEEHYTLLVSLDTRDSMRLPESLPKLQVAAWVAEALARITLKTGDEVILHRLFGEGSNGFIPLKGPTQANRAGAIIRSLADAVPEDRPNLAELHRFLPPSAIWVILTDFYFSLSDGAHPLARQISEAQEGWRWIILIDLDSWEHEQAHLGIGPRKVAGPGALPKPDFDISRASLTKVQENISAHKDRFFTSIQRSRFDRSLWRWPAAKQIDPAEFFGSAFAQDPYLKGIFRRSP